MGIYTGSCMDFFLISKFFIGIANIGFFSSTPFQYIFLLTCKIMGVNLYEKGKKKYEILLLSFKFIINNTPLIFHF